MGKSTDRVKAAAEAAGLPITIVTMPTSTRTAEEAAAACGCAVGQIVKSLIFEGATSGDLILLLVSGANRVDDAKAAAAVGEPLTRADPRKVRDVTGFAIGGVAPIGHLSSLRTLMDADLLALDIVWAAAGAPHSVFAAEPEAFRKAAGAAVADLKGL